MGDLPVSLCQIKSGYKPGSLQALHQVIYSGQGVIVKVRDGIQPLEGLQYHHDRTGPGTGGFLDDPITSFRDMIELLSNHHPQKSLDLVLHQVGQSVWWRKCQHVGPLVLSAPVSVAGSDLHLVGPRYTWGYLGIQWQMWRLPERAGPISLTSLYDLLSACMLIGLL